LFSVFKDKNTPSPFIEDLSQYGDNGESAKAAKPDHIYMDCMGFGELHKTVPIVPVLILFQSRGHVFEPQLLKLKLLASLMDEILKKNTKKLHSV
jgi:hypothetical protein